MFPWTSFATPGWNTTDMTPSSPQCITSLSRRVPPMAVNSDHLLKGVLATHQRAQPDLCKVTTSLYIIHNYLLVRSHMWY